VKDFGVVRIFLAI